MQTVRKGRSLPFVFDRAGASISGFICTIEVKQFPGDVSAISRVITPTNNKWTGFLTSTETAALDPIGEWMLIGVITNATDDKEETPIIRFSLAEEL